VAEARREYRKFVVAGIKKPPANPLDGARAQIALGSEEFIREIRDKVLSLGEPSFEVPAARKMARWTRKEADAALKAVALRHGVETENLKECRRHRNGPRDEAIEMFYRHSGWSMKEIGEKFGTKHGAIRKALNRRSAGKKMGPREQARHAK